MGPALAAGRNRDAAPGRSAGVRWGCPRGGRRTRSGAEPLPGPDRGRPLPPQPLCPGGRGSARLGRLAFVRARCARLPSPQQHAEGVHEARDRGHELDQPGEVLHVATAADEAAEGASVDLGVHFYWLHRSSARTRGRPFASSRLHSARRAGARALGLSDRTLRRLLGRTNAANPQPAARAQRSRLSSRLSCARQKELVSPRVSVEGTHGYHGDARAPHQRRATFRRCPMPYKRPPPPSSP
jgi:hypothetical protein